MLYIFPGRLTFWSDDLKYRKMSSVTALLDPVKEWVGADKPKISSIVFSLTTKVTVVLILVFSLLVTASTYFGDPIDCIVEEVPSGISHRNIIVKEDRYYTIIAAYG